MCGNDLILMTTYCLEFLRSTIVLIFCVPVLLNEIIVFCTCESKVNISSVCPILGVSIVIQQAGDKLTGVGNDHSLENNKYKHSHNIF